MYVCTVCMCGTCKQFVHLIFLLSISLFHWAFLFASVIYGATAEASINALIFCSFSLFSLHSARLILHCLSIAHKKPTFMSASNYKIYFLLLSCLRDRLLFVPHNSYSCRAYVAAAAAASNGFIEFIYPPFPSIKCYSAFESQCDCTRTCEK